VPIIGGAVFSVVIVWIMKNLPVMSFFILIIYGVAFYIFYLSVMYFIGLMDSEKKEIHSMKFLS
jgi:multisubunit Na+/H+ antiporter MnhE subunit